MFYSGNVQGVGFRFTAERVALKLSITGFVKNLPNGTVEAVCEGSHCQLEAFLEDLRGVLDAYISDVHVEWESPRSEFGSFDIRF